jgi:hypothetical protein
MLYECISYVDNITTSYKEWGNQELVNASKCMKQAKEHLLSFDPYKKYENLYTSINAIESYYLSRKKNTNLQDLNLFHSSFSNKFLELTGSSVSKNMCKNMLQLIFKASS